MAIVETPYYYPENSFRYLFDRFKNQLYGFVLGMVRQPYTAEEITLDIFFELWLRREILHEVSDLEEHVFHLSRFTVRNHLSKGQWFVERYQAEHGEELLMRGLWDELKIQPVEYPVDWEWMYGRMNRRGGEDGVGEERRARILVRVAIVFFLLMAAVAAYFSVKR
jgi:DNA-directed RNA polymerase specialized sigma24 family protein